MSLIILSCSFGVLFQHAMLCFQDESFQTSAIEHISTLLGVLYKLAAGGAGGGGRLQARDKRHTQIFNYILFDTTSLSL